MPIDLHIGAPLSAPLSDQIAFFKRAEALGFDGVGIADDPLFGGDAFVTIAAAARETERIWLYPAVTNPVTRHPFVLAGLAGALTALAPGRVKLAIGTGDSGVVFTGAKPAKLAELRDAVDAIRKLLRGEAASVGDSPEQAMPQASGPPARIAVAASGPKTLEMAGATADEALVTVGVDPSAVQAANNRVAAGAARAGRQAGTVPVTHYVIVSIDDDHDTAVERTRRWLFMWLQQGMFDLCLQALGMERPNLSSPEELDKPMLEELAERFFIAGTPKEASARAERLSDDGIQSMFCMLPGGPKRHWEHLDLVARHVMPAI